MKIEEAVGWLEDIKDDYSSEETTNDEYRRLAIDTAIKSLNMWKWIFDNRIIDVDVLWLEIIKCVQTSEEGRRMLSDLATYLFVDKKDEGTK